MTSQNMNPAMKSNPKALWRWFKGTLRPVFGATLAFGLSCLFQLNAWCRIGLQPIASFPLFQLALHEDWLFLLLVFVDHESMQGICESESLVPSILNVQL